MHDLSIIVTLAGALAVALAFGWATQRIGLSTLVGYLVAGVVVGPFTPGFVADRQLASQMAEIGVILLMFGVGLHFHPQELLRVWRIAVPGAIAQSAIAAAAGWAVGRAAGWSHAAGLVFGMALAVASTVVLIRMLVERDRLGTREGHVAVGWLIVEDLFTVLGLVVLPIVAADSADAASLAREVGGALGKVALFALLVWALGTGVMAPIMERIARSRSTELFTLMIFVIALGIALLASELFNVSVALGAFFAGLAVGQSRFGAQAAADMAPFRDVFSALFFVSVGMLFDPALLGSQPLLLAAALAIVLVLKPLAALVVVSVLRDTRRTALTVAVGLAQIGEFSFILGALGQSLGVLPKEAMDALVFAAIASIAVNPLLFSAMKRMEARWEALAPRPGDGQAASQREAAAVASACSVVIAGAGPLGKRLAQACAAKSIPACAIGADADALEELRGQGVAVFPGDPGEESVLRAAGVAQARVFVATQSALADRLRACAAARSLNPRIALVAVADSAGERVWLEEFGSAYVCDTVEESSASLLRAIRTAL
jgi:CPA2 family monovalent cation:H+ antiporter-2